MEQNSKQEFDLEKYKEEILLKPLESAEDLRNWIDLFLDIRFPVGTVHPESSHSPVAAMWRIYELFKTGGSADVPQVTLLASRDSFKTLSAAAIEVLCMLHFRIPMAHMAAIKQQSAKAVQYVSSFFRKLRPYLNANGWSKSSDSKTYIEWITDKNEVVYLNIVTCTIAGANCIDFNSMVCTPEGMKKAHELKQGDLLKSFDIWGDRYIYTKVLNTGIVEADSRELKFEDGSNIILGHKHKVFTKRGWVHASNLKIGDKVLPDKEQEIFNTKIKPSLTKIKWNLNSLIYGTLLGDASIQKLPSGNCRYQVFHCEEQKPYLIDIQKTFLENGIKASIIKDRLGYKLYTQTHEIFKFAHSICYRNNIKTITPMWLPHIDEEAVAFSIMDDGTTHRKKVGRYKESAIDIALMGFKVKELEKLVNHFKKMGYEAKAHAFSKKYNQIRIPINHSRGLSEDIIQYFPDYFKYKLCYSDNQKFCIDTGTYKESTSSKGFSWDDKKLPNTRGARRFSKRIKSQLSKTIVDIKLVGLQKLIGITIKDDDFNKKSFFANGTLVHNSEHVPLLCIDEVDVVQNPQALKEAKMIPSVYGKYFPLTVYLSTRKFAGGLMEKTLKETINAGGEVLRWNILDVCERIPHEIAKINEPKVPRYISRELPMVNVSPEEWSELSDERKNDFERFEAYSGIAEHQMLPIMKNYLVDRPQDQHGGLYKPLVSVHNNFKQIEPDMANAQLLCNKPSSSGLVYPRFIDELNTLTPEQAYEKISGDPMPETVTNPFEFLVEYLKDLGITFIGGADWGYTDFTSLVVIALLPGGEMWLLDSFVEDKLELDDIVKYCLEFQEKYGITKWYAEQAYPAYLKTLKRKGMKFPKFKKVVEDGITAIQSKIVDSNNRRSFYVIRTPNNQIVRDAFGEYRWSLDGKGEIIEGKPFHDKEGVSDVMDSIRYPFQNIVGKGGSIILQSAGGTDNKKTKRTNKPKTLQEMANEANQQIMKNKVNSLAVEKPKTDTKKNRKKILWV